MRRIESNSGEPPSTRQEELRSFLFFTVVMAPALAVILVSGYGFIRVDGPARRRPARRLTPGALQDARVTPTFLPAVGGHGRRRRPPAALARAARMARLKANDSFECRNCQGFDYMDFTRQSPRASQAHSTFLAKGERTCIDCHKGIAHRLPDLAQAK